MIKVILDKVGSARNKQNKANYLVTQTEQYIAVRQAIYEAECEEKDITVYVSDPVCCHWFWDLEKHPSVVVKKYDPCFQLKEKLGVLELPADIEKYPEVILELDLLFEHPPDDLVDIWSWILERKVGKCWAANTPSIGHLYALVSWFLDDNAITEDKFGLLKSHQENQVKTWLEKAKGRLQKAYHWFLVDPKRNAAFLLGFQILKPYSQELKEEWIQGLSPNFDSFNSELFVELPALPRLLSGISTVDKHVKMYWQSRLRKEKVNFEKKIVQTSGELPGELEAFSEWLERNPTECTQQKVDLIRLQFRALSKVGDVCSRLEALIAPRYPKKPQVNWRWNEWTKWAIREYLPYRSWLESNALTDVKLDKYSMIYSDWLYIEYPKYIFSFEPLVYGIFRNIKKRVEEGHTVLWILVDNLSWMWGQELIEIFEDKDIHVAKQPCLRLSMLPSETTVSKSAILAGRPQSLLEHESCWDMIRGCWAQEGNYQIRYNANEKNLRRLFSEPAQIYIYQYDRLDSLAHESEYRIIDRKRIVRDALVWLADVVREDIELLPGQLNLRIIVCSDHGSTLIQKGGRNLRPPRLAVEDEKSRKHKRFIKILDAAELNQVDWYVLPAEKFALKDNYAVAKNYSYLRSRPQGYTHGGMTPEETLVPYLEFCYGAAKPIYPIQIVHRSQPILRGREQKIILVLQNPNRFPVTEVSLRLPRYFVEAQIDSIDAESEEQISELNIVLEPKLTVEEGCAEIEGICSYKAYEKSYTDTAKVKLKVREIFRVREFEDLL